MADMSKFSPDSGSTILNVKDRNAVHWADNGILGAKNLLKCTGVTTTNNGVTFTVNSDGTISTSGTASGGRAKLVYQVYYYGESNPYLTGCPSGGGSNYWIDLYDYDTSTHNNEYGSGATTTIANGHKIDININVAEGTNSNGLVFKPMLRLATDTDSTYAPYAMTNRELTENVIPEDITNNYFTAFPENVTLKNGSVYKIGKLIIGNIVINKTDNFELSTDVKLSVDPKYLPRVAINNIAFLLTSEWGVQSYNGYMFINSDGQNQQFIINNIVSGTSNLKFAKINFVYCCK